MRAVRSGSVCYGHWARDRNICQRVGQSAVPPALKSNAKSDDEIQPLDPSPTNQFLFFMFSIRMKIALQISVRGFFEERSHLKIPICVHLKPHCIARWQLVWSPFFEHDVMFIKERSQKQRKNWHNVRCCEHTCTQTRSCACAFWITHTSIQRQNVKLFWFHHFDSANTVRTNEKTKKHVHKGALNVEKLGIDQNGGNGRPLESAHGWHNRFATRCHTQHKHIQLWGARPTRLESESSGNQSIRQNIHLHYARAQCVDWRLQTAREHEPSDNRKILGYATNQRELGNVVGAAQREIR